MHFPTDRTAHTTAFDEPVVDHWLERTIAVHMERHISARNRGNGKRALKA